MDGPAAREPRSHSLTEATCLWHATPGCAPTPDVQAFGVDSAEAAEFNRQHPAPERPHVEPATSKVVKAKPVGKGKAASSAQPGERPSKRVRGDG